MTFLHGMSMCIWFEYNVTRSEILILLVRGRQLETVLAICEQQRCR